jgi:NADH/NAD ratio-sensing transcriptional regulator Rex
VADGALLRQGISNFGQLGQQTCGYAAGHWQKGRAKKIKKGATDFSGTRV